MNTLSSKKCVPCEGGTPPLSHDQIESLRREISSEWRVIDEKKLAREFTFKNFVEAMAFVNRVASIAEEQKHHPDLHIFYNKVTVELWTHAVGGLSENDFIVASKINQLV